MTLIQRFGSTLNLNVHFHMLFLDGVYLVDGADPPVFRHVAAPHANDLQALIEQIAVGPRAGQKLFTLRTVPPRLQGVEGDLNGAARAGSHCTPV